MTAMGLGPPGIYVGRSRIRHSVTAALAIIVPILPRTGPLPAHRDFYPPKPRPSVSPGERLNTTVRTVRMACDQSDKSRLASVGRARSVLWDQHSRQAAASAAGRARAALNALPIKKPHTTLYNRTTG